VIGNFLFSNKIFSGQIFIIVTYYFLLKVYNYCVTIFFVSTVL